MDIGQLEAFVQVASLRNFSKAAEALYLTQPSVTARIQSLEKELGEDLFERTGRGVRLTDAGLVFLPYAERILRTLQEGRDTIEGVRNVQVGTLRLGSAQTISTYVLPGLLKSFRTRYPGITLSVKTGRSEQVLSMVLNDEVQIGLVRVLNHHDVDTVHLYEDEIVLVTDPHHPFASRGSVTLDEVAEEPLLVYDRTSSYYGIVTNVFRQRGIVPHTAMELDSMEATKKMVEEGMGIALLPKVSLERELKLGILTEVPISDAPKMSREISLIYRKNRKLSRPVQSFMELLQETYHLDLSQVSSS